MKTLKRYGITVNKEFALVAVSPECIKYIEEMINLEIEKGIKFRPNALSEFVFVLNLAKYRAEIKKFDIGSDIRDTISKDYSTYMRIISSLIDWGLLEIGKSYITGFKGKDFTLKGLAAVKGFTSIPFSENDPFFTLIYNIEEKQSKEMSLLVAKYNNFEGVSFNGSIEDLNDKEKEQIKNIEEKKFNTFINDKKEGRLYSPFVALPKTVRNQLISNNGNPMAVIDIKASHPRLLAKTLYEFLPLAEYLGIFITDLEIELGQFMSLANIDLYEFFAEKINKSRSYTKRAVLMFMMNHWKSGEFSIISDIMKIEFPLISKLITSLHRLERSTYIDIKEKKYSIDRFRYSISLRLMRLESSFIMNTSRNFIEKHPLDNLITVHDSIIVDVIHKNTIIEDLKDMYNMMNIPFDYSIENEDILSNVNIEDLKKGKGIEYHILFNKGNLIPTKSRERKTNIKKLKDGRFTVSIKNKQINSRKNESLDDFTSRVFA